MYGCVFFSTVGCWRSPCNLKQHILGSIPNVFSALSVKEVMSDAADQDSSDSWRQLLPVK